MLYLTVWTLRFLLRGTPQLNVIEPPSEPTHENQLDALRKGLGRAALWAQAGRLDHGLLRAACLNDWRFDKHFDDNRATYLWNLLEFADLCGELSLPVVRTLRDTDDPEVARQLYGLAFQYALAGESSHRHAVYSHYARLCRSQSVWSADGYLIALDGFEGFEFCLAQRSSTLGERDWSWQDSELISTAKEEFGVDWVERYIEESTDPDIIRFRDRLRLDEQSDESSFSARAVSPVESLDEIKMWLDLPASEQPRYLRFRYRATDEARSEVLRWIQNESDARRIARMFALLGSRELPRFDTSILRFCLHPDAEVRDNACRAIGWSQHPAIRELALRQIDSGKTDAPVMRLLARNSEPGDFAQLTRVFELETDEDQLHEQLMSVCDILESYHSDEGVPMALIAYRNNPCSYCRSSIVEHLAKNDLAPEWLIEECRFDAQEETRVAFE